jgi:hypothetical protein
LYSDKDIEYSIPISGFPSKVAVQKVLKKSLFSIQLEVFGEIIYEKNSKQSIGSIFV